jgi:hypothetical protein
MTPEARLDGLERVAMLLVRAGYRARSQFREQLREHDRMLNHVFDLQIENENRFLLNEKRFAQNEERFAKLLESQSVTDRELNSLIEIIKEGRNGENTRDRRD